MAMVLFFFMLVHGLAGRSHYLSWIIWRSLTVKNDHLVLTSYIVKFKPGISFRASENHQQFNNFPSQNRCICSHF